MVCGMVTKVPGIMVSGLGNRTVILMAKRKLFGVAMVGAEVLFDLC